MAKQEKEQPKKDPKVLYKGDVKLMAEIFRGYEPKGMSLLKCNELSRELQRLLLLLDGMAQDEAAVASEHNDEVAAEGKENPGQ